MECGSYDDRAPRTPPQSGDGSSSQFGETAKEQVQKILAALPDDASLETIRYHIDIRQKVQQGWDVYQTISLEEMLTNLLEKWSNRAWSSAR